MGASVCCGSHSLRNACNESCYEQRPVCGALCDGLRYGTQNVSNSVHKFGNSGSVTHKHQTRTLAHGSEEATYSSLNK